jgi:hypothetical protein
VKYGEHGIEFESSEDAVDERVWKDLGRIAEHSIARKTWSTYGTAERMLAKFCREKQKPLELPVNESTVLEFVHWLIFTRNLSAASISGYLAGIKKLHVIKGIKEPKIRSNLVKMILEGKKNMEAASGKTRDGKRATVTPLIMKLIKTKIYQWNAVKIDKLMAWSVCTLLFHGALRGAELLARNTSQFDPAYTLRRCDICRVVQNTGGIVIQLKLKSPKESSNKAGVVVDVYQTDTEICPTRAVSKWLAATEGAAEEQPAFRFASGVPLTGSKLNKLLKEWIGDVVPGVSTHSFRIGAASMMGKLGFSDNDVKAVCRWGSRAFESYIRLPRTKRKMVAEKLAKLWHKNR